MAARRMNPQQMGMGNQPQMRSQLPGGQGPRGMPQPGMLPEHVDETNMMMQGDPNQHGQMVSNSVTYNFNIMLKQYTNFQNNQIQLLNTHI